jgi:putative membrane protein
LTRQQRILFARVALLTLSPAVARAHAGRAPEPHDLWSAWTLAPVVLLGLGACTLLYIRGLRALHARARRSNIIPRWRSNSFLGGVAALFIALISPIDAVGAALFSVHMLQHLLLVVVAAPLLLMSDPLFVSLWALPLQWRRRVGRFWRRATTLRAAWRTLRVAPVAWTVHVAMLWVWHLPSLYESALRNEAVHVLEHSTFFLTALLFWWLLVAPHGRRLGVGSAMMYLFAAALQCTILGAVMTFARHPWYPSHYATTRAWGLTPLEDQQLAGLLMWIPAGLVYVAALVPVLIPVLRGGAGRRVGASAVAPVG